MPKTICVAHAKTLEEAKYYLKLMFNITHEFYQHSTLTLINGNGQGSTNYPAAWLFIHNIILNIIENMHIVLLTRIQKNVIRLIYIYQALLMILISTLIYSTLIIMTSPTTTTTTQGYAAV